MSPTGCPCDGPCSAKQPLPRPPNSIHHSRYRTAPVPPMEQPRTMDKTKVPGLCIALQWFGVSGIRALPEEANDFPQCTDTIECPLHSSCVETNKGYHCACDNSHYNDVDRLTITYPGGKCIAFCPKPENTPGTCACRPGFRGFINNKGLYECKDTCDQNDECPFDAVCKRSKCYCDPGLCNSQISSVCVESVKPDGKCVAQSDTVHQTTKGTSLVTVLQTSQPVLTTTSVLRAPTTSNAVMTTTAALTPTAAALHITSSPLQTTQTAVICPKGGSRSPCVCGPGTIKANENYTLGLHFCKDKCDSDEDCPSGATCQKENCYCSENLCNSKFLSKCVKLLKLDEECQDFTTTQEPTQITTLAPRPPTTQPENKRCPLQPSEELEKCQKSMSQDEFCNLLRQNARIQNISCYKNDTNTTVEQVANQFTEVLNQTNLNNLTTSELRSAVTSIVESVETSLLKTFSKEPQNQNISTPELEVQVKTSADVCGGGGTSITLVVLENTMKVPCTHLSGYKDGAILVSYKGLESTLNSSLLQADVASGHKNVKEINSPIISGAITSPNTENLDPPINFYLKQLKDVPPFYILQCVFLDTELKIWSSRGCDTKKSDRVNSTLCVCNHLSTFAVLMAPREIEADAGLVWISRIGLTVSLVCLCLSLLTFILCQSIKSAHTSILKILCGCLFLGQLLALLGLHQTGNKILCAVIAGLLQFSFLCAFCWMSLESALLFMTVRNLQAMNYMTSKRSLLPYASLAGFGIPLIIIGISAAMRPNAYGTENYCWLTQEHVWSFLGPVCVFITINFILLVLTFVLLKKKLASLNTNVSTLKHTRLLTFKALSQLFILGCTWIIGLFQFGSVSLVISYIFTILNSIQGLYIFCVHCLLNHQVREEYRRRFHCFRVKKSDSEAMSGSTVPMTIKSSQASEVPGPELKSVSAVDNQEESDL